MAQKTCQWNVQKHYTKPYRIFKAKKGDIIEKYIQVFKRSSFPINEE